MQFNSRILLQRLCPFFLAVAVAIPSAHFSGPLFAQSGAQYLQWLEWCRSIGGTPTGGASNPRCIPGNQGPTEEQLRFARAKEKHDQALQLWNTEDWDRIIPLLEEAVAIWADPVFVSNLNQAREARAAKIKRGHYLRHFHAGNAAYNAKQWAEAIRNYEAALALEPSDPATIGNLQKARAQLADELAERNRGTNAVAAINDSIQRLHEQIANPVATDRYFQLGHDIANSPERITELLDDKSLATLEHKARVEVVLRLLATRWNIALPHVASPEQWKITADHIQSELRGLLVQALASATFRMMKDLENLEPWPWNPFGNEQRAEIRRLERQIAEAKTRAQREIESQDAFREISLAGRTALQFRSGPALAELQQINRTMNWDK